MPVAGRIYCGAETRTIAGCQTMTEAANGPRIEHPAVIDKEDIGRYVDDGFLVVEDLLTSAELDELKGELVAIARGRYPSENLQPLPDELPDDEVLSSILAIHHPHLISPVVRAYAAHEKVCGVLAQIVGAHLPHWDGSVKGMQTMLFVKPPGYQGQAWHQDELYIQTRDRSLTGVWIAIDDATVGNGCMCVIPGSQRSGYLWPQREHDEPEEFDDGAISYGFDDAAAVPVEVAAGSIVFFDGYLLHSSGRNRSSGYRRALVNHYMNAWSLLPWSNPDLPVPSDGDRRAIMVVAGADPYGWKGIAKHHRTPYLRRCAANSAALPAQAGIDESMRRGGTGMPGQKP